MARMAEFAGKEVVFWKLLGMSQQMLGNKCSYNHKTVLDNGLWRFQWGTKVDDMWLKVFCPHQPERLIGSGWEQAFKKNMCLSNAECFLTTILVTFNNFHSWHDVINFWIRKAKDGLCSDIFIWKAGKTKSNSFFWPGGLEWFFHIRNLNQSFRLRRGLGLEKYFWREI